MVGTKVNLLVVLIQQKPIYLVLLILIVMWKDSAI